MLKIYRLDFNNPTYNTVVLMLQTAEFLLKAMSERLNDDHISLPQLRLMYSLKHHNRPITTAEICRCIARESQTAVGEINDLLDKGYVRKTLDPNNKRRTRIHLTESGHQLLNEHHRWAFKAMEEILSCFTEDELQQFQKHLKKLRGWICTFMGIDLIEPLNEFQAELHEIFTYTEA